MVIDQREIQYFVNGVEVTLSPNISVLAFATNELVGSFCTPDGVVSVTGDESVCS